VNIFCKKFSHSSSSLQTDRRTDGQTDRRKDDVNSGAFTRLRNVVNTNNEYDMHNRVLSEDMYAKRFLLNYSQCYK